MADSGIELIIWTDAARVTLAKQIINQLKDRVTILAVGGERTATVTDLARDFDLPFDDDLRKIMVDHPPSGMLFLSMQQVSMRDLETMAQAQMIVHTIVPVTSTIANVSTTTVRCKLLPQFNQCNGWTQAADPLESLGKLDQIHFTSVGSLADASLFARLVDSWEHILSLIHMPTAVDAVLSSSKPIPENLEKITGHLSIQGRLAGGGCIQMLLSDHAAMSHRQMTLLGHDAQLIVTDTRYELYQPDGTIIDQWACETQMPCFGELVSDGCHAALTNPYAQAIDDATLINRRQAALGCAHACLISARTGEPETPARILELQV
ncbi:MAG: hypothetical protein JKX85_08620 [Phycisphaeraceae bacterium]|nr:hypothetical protein [Phycisphaeraceae bacterium]